MVDDVAEPSGAAPAASDRSGPIAYCMSRFPRLTETFVLSEILALEADGFQIDVYPLIRERPSVSHAHGADLVRRARYLPFVSFAIVRTQLHFLRRTPRRYMRTLRDLIAGTWRSPNFLVGGLAIFPKVAHAARMMRADGVTHLHCHFANHPALAGFIVHRLTGIPYSFTAHGSDLHVDRRMLCQKVSEAAFVVTISEYNREVIRVECGDEADARVVVIHTGVDTDHFRPTSQPGPVETFTIVCVGTLHEVKGQLYLIRACGHLAERGVAFQCHLVGDGADRQRLIREIESLGLSGLVHLEGQLDRDAVRALLQRATVLVAPSVPTREGKREGIPVVLMEAMASGLPVVASRLSGIPELVEDDHSGLLVEPRDDTAIANALQRLHDSADLRQRLAAEGRKKVMAEFDTRANARLLAERFGGRQDRPTA